MKRAKLGMPVGDDGEDLPSGERGVSSSAPSLSSTDSESAKRHGGWNSVSFEKMGQVVSSRWRMLDAKTRAHYQSLA
jgi:hypothetical protein